MEVLRGQDIDLVFRRRGLASCCRRSWDLDVHHVLIRPIEKGQLWSRQRKTMVRTPRTALAAHQQPDRDASGPVPPIAPYWRTDQHYPPLRPATSNAQSRIVQHLSQPSPRVRRELLPRPFDHRVRHDACIRAYQPSTAALRSTCTPRSARAPQRVNLQRTSRLTPLVLVSTPRFHRPRIHLPSLPPRLLTQLPLTPSSFPPLPLQTSRSCSHCTTRWAGE